MLKHSVKSIGIGSSIAESTSGSKVVLDSETTKYILSIITSLLKYIDEEIETNKMRIGGRDNVFKHIFLNSILPDHYIDLSPSRIVFINKKTSEEDILIDERNRVIVRNMSIDRAKELFRKLGREMINTWIVFLSTAIQRKISDILSTAEKRKINTMRNLVVYIEPPVIHDSHKLLEYFSLLSKILNKDVIELDLVKSSHEHSSLLLDISRKTIEFIRNLNVEIDAEALSTEERKIYEKTWFNPFTIRLNDNIVLEFRKEWRGIEVHILRNGKILPIFFNVFFYTSTAWRNKWLRRTLMVVEVNHPSYIVTPVGRLDIKEAIELFGNNKHLKILAEGFEKARKHVSPELSDLFKKVSNLLRKGERRPYYYV